MKLGWRVDRVDQPAMEALKKKRDSIGTLVCTFNALVAERPPKGRITGDDSGGQT
jgi:hypothetical protein